MCLIVDDGKCSIAVVLDGESADQESGAVQSKVRRFIKLLLASHLSKSP